MLLSTPVACVSVSPYRSRDPAGASGLITGGVVPLIHIEAVFAGINTLADIGDVAVPTNFTVPGGAGCCAPVPTGARTLAPTHNAIAPSRFLIAPTGVLLAPQGFP